MAQRWYQKATVQAAIATGVIAVLGAIVGDVLVRPKHDNQNGLFYTEAHDNSTKLTDRELPVGKIVAEDLRQPASVRLTKRNILYDGRWEELKGLLPPAAVLDIWVRYSGPSVLYIDSITLTHIPSTAASAVSGGFNAAAEYSVRYDPGTSARHLLRPPLLVKNGDEIRFEIEYAPTEEVSGVSHCVGFLNFHGNGLVGSIPLLGPYPIHAVMGRVLSSTLSVPFPDRPHLQLSYTPPPSYTFSRHYGMSPGESLGVNGEFLLESDGSIVVSTVQPVPLMRGLLAGETLVSLRNNTAELEEIARSVAEPDEMAEAAIYILAQLNTERAEMSLRAIELSPLSERRRLAARHALRMHSQRGGTGTVED